MDRAAFAAFDPSMRRNEQLAGVSAVEGRHVFARGWDGAVEVPGGDSLFSFCFSIPCLNSVFSSARETNVVVPG
jgi:hypothetical protein